VFAVPLLFSPLKLGPIELPNRIVVSPMCQYSASDGSASDWHLQHLMQFAISRAGMIVLEATAVERRGRISHGCLGLYSDSNERALARVLGSARAIAAPGTAFAIQLAHAGRKASCQPPFQGARPLRNGEDPWPVVAPSAMAFAEGWPAPEALDSDGLKRVLGAFTKAAERSVRLGFDAIELHVAHGYLLHEFLSPFSNRRTDQFGGNACNRMRWPLQVVRAVRTVVPRTIALGARITGSDWADGGLAVEDAVAFASALKEAGLDYVCVSSGGNVAHAKIPLGPGYQVPFAAKVKAATGLATRAVGLIATPEQAQAILDAGEADFVALARAFLDDPRWVWHAAERLGAEVSYPPQYARVARAIWPGAELVRPNKPGAAPG
jgi:2,4-dienoyl-CoA reductase-like NADH-dependent reductase (Old Yellow Enzyme family)